MGPLQPMHLPAGVSRGMGPTWLEIDLQALQHNVRRVMSACAEDVRLIAVVKADAYGHGLVRAGRAALDAGACMLAVARASEGIRLRQQGLVEPILVMGYVSEDELADALAHRLTLTVWGWHLALALSSLAVSTGISAAVHLKVDTGMHRLGVDVADAARFVRALHGLPGIALEGLYTHFATADEPQTGAFVRQLDAFNALVRALEADRLRPPTVHAANSAAALTCPASHFDAVRVGLALYGIEPVRGREHDLRPVMSVKARVTRVLDVPAGQGVSYGHAYVAPSALRAAVVACGYADGYLRALSDRAEVLIGGRRCRVLGIVCMDSVIVGLPDDLHVHVGDEAVVLGQQEGERVGAEELAALAGTIPYELVCGMGRRSERAYIE